MQRSPAARWVSRASVAARRGIGLVGDRYATGDGYWQDARVSRDLTLVESEVLDDLRQSGIDLAAGELRRNVTTRAIRLNDLLGSTFWIGDVLCHATELCEPCRLKGAQIRFAVWDVRVGRRVVGPSR